MRDTYSEDLVKGKPGLVSNILFSLSILLILIGISMALFVSGFGVSVVIIAVVILVITMSKRNVEFEYIITNGDVDVAIIYNKATRKNKYSFKLEEINYIAKYNSPRIDGELTQGKIKTTHNFTDGNIDDNTYGFVIEKSGVKELVVLRLSEKSTDIFKSGAKNKFYND